MRHIAKTVTCFLREIAAHRLGAFWAIFAVSVAIRLVILLSGPERDIVNFAEAERIGRNLAETGSFGNPYVLPTGATAHCPPFYPFVVSIVYRTFGTSIAGGYARCVATIIMYSVLFALQPYFAELLGLPRIVGVLAGFLSAAVPLNRSAEVFMGWEEPYTALILAYLLPFTVFVWRKEHKLSVWICFGVLWGIAFHIAPSLLPIACMWCMLHVFFLSANRRLQFASRWAVAALAAILVLVPWTLRNRFALGSWMYMRDNLGLELYLANSDEAAPSLEANLHSGWMAKSSPYMSRDAALGVQRMGEPEFNRLLLARAVNWIEEHPVRFCTLICGRILYFWFGPFEHPTFAILNGFVSLLGLAGLSLVRKRCSADVFWLFVVTWTTYPLMYYIIQFSVRHRVPIRWMVMLCASWTLCEGWARLRSWTTPLFANIHPERVS